MKILLQDNASIIEYLYRKTKGEKVELTMHLCDADAVVASPITPSFYNKTLIIVSERLPPLDDLTDLIEVNKVISRLPLPPSFTEDYTIDPYELIKLENLEITTPRSKPLSILALKDYSFKKSKDKYRIEGSSSYLGVKYKNFPTIIGLLKHQLEE